MDFAPDDWPDASAGSTRIPIGETVPDQHALEDVNPRDLEGSWHDRSIAGQDVGTDRAEHRRDGPGEEGLDVFESLALEVRPGEGSSTRPSGARRRPSRWRRRLMLGVFLATHLALFGAFYLLVLHPSTAIRRAPALDSTDRPVATRGARPQPQAGDRLAEPARAAPPVVAQAAGPDPTPERRSRKPSSSDRKTPERAGRSDRRRTRAALCEPPMRVQVRPVFFAPSDEAEPTAEQKRRFARHLDWCHRRYDEVLRGRDNFTLADGPALVHRSRVSLAELRAAPESGAPRLTGELLAATHTNRFNCPYVFVIVVMNPYDDFPIGGGRPLNGGYNTGGGIVILSSFALDNLPNIQSTLQHELGHAFGLPHVDVYGHDMKTDNSIMSYNPAHHTRRMRPSPKPGILMPEDLRGLSFNRRAFPNLTFRPARDIPAGYALAPAVALGPMTIDGQPPYKVDVTTASGEAYGTKVANVVQNRIRPSRGGQFDSRSMWQGRRSPDGWAAIRVIFPTPVTLVSIGVHSQHSGTYNAADGVRVRALTRDGAALLAESSLDTTDALVPLSEPATAQAWEIEFHAANNKEVTIRGLRFLTRSGEIFPPPIPPESDPAWHG
jgi:hypothetical protein